MSDLIDRNSLLRSLEKFAPEKHDALVEMLIKKEPTVDAVPVRHGKWIDRNGNIVAPFWERYECSVCGARSDDSNYCHNCGAKMESEHETD